ncbi:MAG: beta-carotene 15,15'-monooxygenase, partial [Capnocytophaga sp.]|nr:beta-carotene 15,15'-monooxygenase [Capnocytophaga sp.]
MTAFGVLYVICALITFGLCFFIISEIVLLFKQVHGDKSPLFQIPKFIPRFKNKWVDRLVSFFILTLFSLFLLFISSRSIFVRTPIPISLFVENIGYYLIIIALINMLILSLMYLFNRTKIFWLTNAKIAWYCKLIFWILLLLI